MSMLAGASNSKRGEYVGRFAPSPTGALHFGSLVAAVGSYLQARVANGAWHLRIDDLDLPRVMPGSADSIIRTLSALGFEWQGAIVYQSTRRDKYAAAIEQLTSDRKLYRCSCSRSQIAEMNLQAVAMTADDEQIYSGHCRTRSVSPDSAHALRCIACDDSIGFVDVLQGNVAQNVAAQVGDFVVRRRDGIHAYHLATVVDDAVLGVTEVVRGSDLLLSTPRQILLQRLLNLPTPNYAHLPLALDSHGVKLSKSSQSLAVDAQNTEILWRALQFLRQAPPEELRGASAPELWNWSIAHWSLWPLSRCRSAIAPLPLDCR